MNPERLKKILAQVKQGKLTVDGALKSLKHPPFEDIGFARIDHHRSLRKGFPEVIYGEGKTAAQVLEIMIRMARQGENILVARLDQTKARTVMKKYPRAIYHPLSRVLTLEKKPALVQSARGTVLVISAGTSDIPVAEEALITARVMGNPVEHLYDLGVAGLHRLLAHQEKIALASVLIVVAGMEGALPAWWADWWTGR
jgi:NCAIR mutase (PurE)-related protein